MIDPAAETNPITAFVRRHSTDLLPVYDLRRTPNSPIDDATVFHCIHRTADDRFVAFLDYFDFQSATADEITFDDLESAIGFYRRLSLDPNDFATDIATEPFSLEHETDTIRVAYIAVTIDF